MCSGMSKIMPDGLGSIEYRVHKVVDLNSDLGSASFLYLMSSGMKYEKHYEWVSKEHTVTIPLQMHV